MSITLLFYAVYVSSIFHPPLIVSTLGVDNVAGF